jgi:hypothetical protein
MEKKTYIYDNGDTSPKQQFEANMTKNAVITLWELLRKCQGITFIMNSSNKLPWPPTDFSSECR